MRWCVCDTILLVLIHSVCVCGQQCRDYLCFVSGAVLWLNWNPMTYQQFKIFGSFYVPFNGGFFFLEMKSFLTHPKKKVVFSSELISSFFILLSLFHSFFSFNSIVYTNGIINHLPLLTMNLLVDSSQFITGLYSLGVALEWTNKKVFLFVQYEYDTILSAC